MTGPSSTVVEHQTESAVIRTLAYFEVFSYPLTQEEVFAFCPAPRATKAAVLESLQNLVEQGTAFRFGEFYQLRNETSWALNRHDYNRRADKFLPIARRMARFIAQFPFVRGVFVSGSLSKHCMRPDSDIDFFVVTAPGRLWLSRTLLVLFKKTFLFNSHKYFCVNYFVDMAHLEIEEKNLFTATESVTLLPMWGQEVYLDFCRANHWAWDRYPHLSPRPTANIPHGSRNWFKKIVEWVFSGKIGNLLDRKAMRATVGFWKRKFKSMDSDTFNLALKSRQGISKHHPLHFQQKVLERYAENLRDYGPAFASK